MIKRFESWFKDKPVTGTIIGTFLGSVLLIAVLKGLNILPSIFDWIIQVILSFVKISIRINVLIFIVAVLGPFSILFSHIIKRKKLNIHNTENVVLPLLTKIDSNKQNEIKIRSDFLKQKEGTFQIWAWIENKNYPKKQFEYFISHCGEDPTKKVLISSKIINADRNIYPFAWAIGRVMPNSVYQLFYNNKIDQVNIAKELNLTEDWHLFSVTWSDKSKEVIFYIDDNLIGKGPFENWPNKLDNYIVVGTWPSKHKPHYFESFLSKPKILSKVLDENQIVKCYTKREI